MFQPLLPETERRVTYDDIHGFMKLKEIPTFGYLTPLRLTKWQILKENTFPTTGVKHSVSGLDICHLDKQLC
jgi:hypothetical protein